MLTKQLTWGHDSQQVQLVLSLDALAASQYPHELSSLIFKFKPKEVTLAGLSVKRKDLGLGSTN